MENEWFDDVSEEVKEELDNLSKENNVSSDFVYTIFKEKYDEIRKKTNYPNEEIEKFTLRVTRSNVLKKARQNNVNEEYEKNEFIHRDKLNEYFFKYCRSGSNRYEYSERYIKAIITRKLNEHEDIAEGDDVYSDIHIDIVRDTVRSVLRYLPEHDYQQFPFWKKERYLNNDWDYLRKSVYKRDGYTCVECGENDDELHAHHIIPRYLSGTESEDNLITLCSDCHSKRHEWL